MLSRGGPVKDYKDGLDRLTYDRSQLAVLLDSELAGSCCCGSDALPKEQVIHVAEALAGKVVRGNGHPLVLTVS